MTKIDKLHFLENSVLSWIHMEGARPDLQDVEDVYDLCEYLKSKNLMIVSGEHGLEIKRTVFGGDSKKIAGGFLI